MLTLADVQSARERLAPVIHRTALIPSRTFSELGGCEVFLKAENLQKTGSFKLRGAYNRIATLEATEKARGVIASSAGNHAQGVAFGAAAHGVKATIVMPETAPVAKVTATRAYGAEVVLAGRVYDEAYAKARDLQEKHGYTFVHPFDDPSVIAGQGTIALEMLEDLPELDALVMPVGGGGLAAGMALAAKAVKPSIRIVGVETERYDAMARSMAAGEMVMVQGSASLADGISVKRPGDLTFELCRRYVDEIVTVSEEEIASAILMLLERAKFVVEGAGAVGLAAVVERRARLEGLKVGVLLSGGNIDINLVSSIIEKGLVKAGRRIRVRTIVGDRPGQLAALMELLGQAGVNVISVRHRRSDEQVDLGAVEIDTVLETRSRSHAEEVCARLRAAGYVLRD
jgi:threonine dehydratase